MVGSRFVRYAGAGLVPTARSTKDKDARGTPCGVRAEEMTRADARTAEAGRRRETVVPGSRGKCGPE
jgi:hypothetical protein